MFDFEIRYARPSDVVELVRLCADHAAHEKAKYDRHAKHKQLTKLLFANDPSLDCFVVVSEFKIIGYATVAVQFSTCLAGEYLHLDCLFIRPGFRGRRIGQQIMDLIRERAVNLRCREVQWQTPIFNTDAMRFYDRLPKSTRRHKLRYSWPIQNVVTNLVQPIQAKGNR